MSTLEINLTGFDADLNSQRYWRTSGRVPDWALHEPEDARRALRESGLTRQCNKVDSIILTIPARVTSITPTFLKHFLGPAARKLGPRALEAKLDLAPHTHRGPMAESICRYLRQEEVRIKERAEKKARANPKDIVWGQPVGLFVPDIGTKMRLCIPWNLTVIAEYRNSAMIELLTGQTGGRSYYHRGPDGRKTWDIVINPGAILAVDRVYIRQGKGFEDYSSLTFRLAKGAEVVYNGQTFTSTKSTRFFTALRFVNQMLVEVDMNTLPGQEKEGTHRK